MRLIYTLFFYAIINSLVAQQTASDYYAQAFEFKNKKEYRKAVQSYKYILENYPQDTLYYRHSLFNLGLTYIKTEDLDSAKAVFLKVLNTDLDNKDYSGNNDIMGNPYANYQNYSAVNLYDIFYKQKQYDSALYYLSLSDTVYLYEHFCGNAYVAQKEYLTVKYADLHEKMGNIQRAKTLLLDWISDDVLQYYLTNRDVIKQLHSLVEREDKLTLYKSVLENVEENIKVEKRILKDETFFDYYLELDKANIYLFYFKEGEEPMIEEELKEFKQSYFYKTFIK